MQIEPDQKSPTNKRLLWIVVVFVCVIVLKFLSPDPADNPPLTQSEIDSVVADTIKKVRPVEELANGYLSSSSCRECHEDQHSSWHSSYHRTMTQVATPESVLGNFDNQQFTFPEGGTYRLGKTNGVLWVEITDHPLLRGTADGQAMRRPIVLTTGSHHMQVYWYATGKGRELGILPLVYLRGEERWIPRIAAFIQPPDETHSLELGRWNRICSGCHSTDPRAGFQKESNTYDTKVSEFGISCESCHGPGEAHVNFQRKRKNSPATDLTDSPDPIVNPSTLDHRKSSQVCGACHVKNKRVDPDGKFITYIPGTDYDKARMPWRMTDEFMDSQMSNHINAVLARFRKETGATTDLDRRHVFKRLAMRYFWPDGTIRIGGREYSGLIQSACHTKGQMSCISCHSMHQSGSDKRAPKEWADDQLQPSKQGDQACLQCHQAEDYRNTEHTHHPLNSAGSSCYNCHMPHSSYALLKAIRSHTIDSPKIVVGDTAGRPNACNLCHLDQTLEWTSKHLADWYDLPMPSLSVNQREVAAGPLWTLQGDAGLRALMAWHIGWQPARDAATTDWSAPYLSLLIDDPYPAVRIIASRTMKKFPPYRQIVYDFLAPPEQRRAPALELVAAWEKQQAGKSHNPATLIGPDGKPQMQRIQSLLETRDLRPVDLAE